ncbi:MAG: hypothetical protein M1819_001913 [Sarea resinae]|nr:MAG: hypothetical protein M1819_001913 [Sarea resinae]
MAQSDYDSMAAPLKGESLAETGSETMRLFNQIKVTETPLDGILTSFTIRVKTGSNMRIHHIEEYGVAQSTQLRPSSNSKDFESTYATNMQTTVMRDAKALQSHIALHLERFSLFALPRFTDDDDMGSNEGESDKANVAFDGSRDGDFDMDVVKKDENDLKTSAIARQRWKIALEKTGSNRAGRRRSSPVSVQCVLSRWLDNRYPTNPSDPKGMHTLARNDFTSGWRRMAERTLVEMLEVRKMVLGPRDERTLTIMFELALIYLEVHQWDNALELLYGIQKQLQPQKALAIRQHILRTQNNRKWGQHPREAGKRMLKVMMLLLQGRLLSLEHQDAEWCMEIMGKMCRDQEPVYDAEMLQKQAMKTSSQLLGQRHKVTLEIVSDLASLYSQEGKWDEAEEMQLQALEASRETLGPYHEDTLEIMSDLASTYIHQGKEKHAEDLLLQILKASEEDEEELEQDDPGRLEIALRLASLYKQQGRWKEASKTMLGQDDLYGINYTFYPAFGSNQAKERTKAEELQSQVLEESKKTLGRDHPDTLAIMSHLASTYCQQGRWKEAEELLLQVLETSKKVLGKGDRRTVEIQTRLVSVYQQQGQWKDAQELLRVLERSDRFPTPAYQGSLSSPEILASTSQHQGGTKDAKEPLPPYHMQEQQQQKEEEEVFVVGPDRGRGEVEEVVIVGPDRGRAESARISPLKFRAPGDDTIDRAEDDDIIIVERGRRSPIVSRQLDNETIDWAEEPNKGVTESERLTPLKLKPLGDDTIDKAEPFNRGIAKIARELPADTSALGDEKIDRTEESTSGPATKDPPFPPNQFSPRLT